MDARSNIARSIATSKAFLLLLCCDLNAAIEMLDLAILIARRAIKIATSQERSYYNSSPRSQDRKSDRWLSRSCYQDRKIQHRNIDRNIASYLDPAMLQS